MKSSGSLTVFAKPVILAGFVFFYSSVTAGQTTDNTVSTTAAVVTDPSTTTIDNTESLQTLASRWGLVAEEYARYQTLMQGPLGKWNPQIDPLLALGMFAKTPQQERHYAERYARQEFELTQRAIHFQQSYRAAFNRLYPNTTVINEDRLQPYFNHRQAKLGINQQSSALPPRRFQNGDTLLYFPEHDCRQCESDLKQLVRLLKGLQNTQVQTYVRGAIEDKAVQRWAADNGVDLQWLQQNLLSLNRDEGLYAKLQNKSGSTTDTSFYLRRNNRFYQLTADDLGL